MDQTDPTETIQQLKKQISYLKATQNHLERDNDNLSDKLKKIQLECHRLTNENKSFKKEIETLNKYKMYVEEHKPTMASFLMDDNTVHNDNEGYVTQNQIEPEDENESISSQSTIQWVATPSLRDNVKQSTVHDGNDSSDSFDAIVSFDSNTTINLADKNIILRVANGGKSSNSPASIVWETLDFYTVEQLVDVHSLEPNDIIVIDSDDESDSNLSPTINVNDPSEFLIDSSSLNPAVPSNDIENSIGRESSASMESVNADFKGFDITDITSVNEVNDLNRFRVKRIRPQPYACSYVDCKRKFKDKGQLKVHRLIHATKRPVKERPFICQEKYCGKRFVTKQNLEQHVLIHSGVKAHVCSYRKCGKRFRQLSNLQAHLRFHTNKKPYVCSEKGCRRKFTQLSALKYHAVNVHNL